MTPDERVRALQGFRYTARQAAFLELVAVHSGYFLLRQYPAFLGRAYGAVTANFLHMLLARGHAKRQTYYGHTHVYHLSAHPLYAAIDEANSRHRRTRPPSTITRKLMTLDVVLGHRDRTFLATEREKVAYFTEQCGVSIEALPHRDYRARDPRGPVTTRYFVDRTPICLTSPSSDPSFVYLGCGESSEAGLETFLTEYACLFRHLQTVRVVYVVGRHDPTGVLPDRFRRAWEGTAVGRPVAVDDASIAVLRRHFRARQRLDQQRWKELSQEDLDRLRRDVRRFSSPEYDAWYRRWCTEGDTALQTVGRVVNPSVGSLEPVFNVWHLPHRYVITGTGGRPCW